MNIDLLALLCREFRTFFQPLLQTATVDTDGNITVDSADLKDFLKSIGYDLDPILPDSAFWDKLKAINEAIVALSQRVKDITPLVEKTLDSIDFPNDIKSLKLTIKELPKDTQGLIDFYTELKPEIDKLISGYKALKDYYKTLTEIENNTNLANAVKRLPAATLNALAYRYLNAKHPAIMPALELMGLAYWDTQIEHLHNGEVVVVENVPPRFHFDKVKPLCKNPGDYLSEIYWPDGYGTTLEDVNKTAKKLFPLIQEILEAFGAQSYLGLPPSELGIVYPPEVTDEMKQRLEGTLGWQMPVYEAGSDQLFYFGAMHGLLANNSSDGGPGVFIIPYGDFKMQKTGQGWLLNLNGTFQNEGCKINRNGVQWFSPGQSAQQTLNLSITPPLNDKWSLGGATRLEISYPEIQAALNLQGGSEPDLDVSLNFQNNQLVISPGTNDFLYSLLDKDETNNGGPFDLKLGWNQQKKFYLEGNLDFTIYLDFTLFHFLRFHHIKLKLEQQILQSGDKVQILQVGVKAGIEFPPEIFQPVNPTPDSPKSEITLELTGEMNTAGRKGFEITQVQKFSFTESYLFNTGFTLKLDDVTLDFSHAKNIPEAVADGRPADFIGVSMKKGTIGFPTDWNHDSVGSTGELYVENFLAGTGGISGTIGLRAKNGTDPAPFISVRFGDKFTVSLTAFSMTFRQNAVLKTIIEGRLDLPGLKDANNNQAQIDIKIHFDHNGDFYITAKEEDGIKLPLNLEKFLTVSVRSLTVGRRSNKFFVALNGGIGFNNENTGGNSLLSGFLPKNIDIQKLLIWENGQIELEGGVVTLAKPIKVNLGPAKLTVTALGMGSHERMHGGELRKYKYVEFSAGLSVSPGGVDARGDGIKVYFTCDNKKPFDLYIRIQSISIDLIIPGSASKEQATLLLNGYLSMKEPTPGAANSDAGTEYAGGIDFKLPKMKMGGSAEMRYNPKVPSFLIDVSLEISTPIVLGATGMGIYGFRALFGKRYIASKTAPPVDLPADAEWWQYYKKKVPPKPREGVTASKMANLPGFSFGAGVSLATAADGGQSFSSKVFFLLSLPDVFLLQGQAQILKGRIGLDTDTDPPFYCLIAIDKTSISSAMGVSYKIPDDGDKPGSIVTVDALIEMAYFWRDSRAWYLNIGRDQPVDRRVRARIFDLFDVYSYFMLNANGIRTGAGASIEKAYNVGPIKASLRAYMDTAGRLSFKPLQIGGSIQIGGTADVKVLGYGFSVVASASLAAEAPKPFIVTGAADACVKVLKKEYCCHFDFTWTFEKKLDFRKIPLIGSSKTEWQDAVKALNMMSLESRNLLCVGDISQIPDPDTWSDPDNDDYILPMDSFIDIEFKKPVNPNGTDPSLRRLGGTNSGAEFTDYIPPQRGKSDRVRHDYYLDKVKIFSWEPVSKTWIEYNVYEALIAGLKKPPFNLTVKEEYDLLQQGQYGFWQIDNPGRYTKLRLLAQNPLSFLRQGTGDTIPEELGTGNGIFCPPPPRRKTCVNFDALLLSDPHGNPYFKEKKVPGNQIVQHQRVLLRIVRDDGELLQKNNAGLKTALSYAGAETLELYLPEASAEVSLLVGTTTKGLTIKYFARRQRTALDPLSGAEEPVFDPAGLPVFDYLLVRTVAKNPAELTDPIPYQDLDNPVDKIEITGKIPGFSEKTNLYCEASISSEAKALLELLNLIGTTEKSLVNKVELLREPYKSTALSLFPNTPATASSLVYTPQIGIPGGNTPLENVLTISFVQDGGPATCPITLTGAMNKDMWQFPGDWSFQSLRPDATAALSGANFNFLIDQVFLPNGQVVSLKGKSTCFPIFHCYDRYLNFFHQICYMTVADALYNQNLPTGKEVKNNNDMMALAINKTLWPVWRPDTAFAIRVDYRDSVSQESTPPCEYIDSFVMCFKTKGPAGHYHEYPCNDPQEHSQKLNSYSDLEKQDREDAFKLSSLKHYIDFPKSYPNADGNILNAKPLYYDNPELRLFYIYPHVYQFYQDWEPYNGLPKVESALEVLIKDPAEPPLVPDPDSPGSQIMVPYQTPLAVNEWQKNDFPIIQPDIAALNNMVKNGAANQNPCLPSQTPFTPQGVNNLVTPDPKAPLEPLKLYTAIYNASYQPVASQKSVREVHRYAFQTSRYKNFKEHINSYLLCNAETGVVEKSAVYRVDVLFKTPDGDDDPMPLIRVKQVLDNELPAEDPLQVEAALDFDKIIDRLFALSGLEPAENVQFNAIFNAASGKILGILVRSPEPFNDPKTPAAELTGTLNMLPANNAKPGIIYFKTYFSKDNSNAFITNANHEMEIPRDTYLIDFKYKLFNGSKYEIRATEQVVIDFTTL